MEQQGIFGRLSAQFAFQIRIGFVEQYSDMDCRDVFCSGYPVCLAPLSSTETYVTCEQESPHPSQISNVRSSCRRLLQGGCPARPEKGWDYLDGHGLQGCRRIVQQGRGRGLKLDGGFMGYLYRHCHGSFLPTANGHSHAVTTI